LDIRKEKNIFCAGAASRCCASKKNLFLLFENFSTRKIFFSEKFFFLKKNFFSKNFLKKIFFSENFKILEISLCGTKFWKSAVSGGFGPKSGVWLVSWGNTLETPKTRFGGRKPPESTLSKAD